MKDKIRLFWINLLKKKTYLKIYKLKTNSIANIDIFVQITVPLFSYESQSLNEDCKSNNTAEVRFTKKGIHF